MSGLLQYYHLKDDKLFQVPPSIPHPTLFFDQGPNKETPYLPTWCVVALGGHDLKVAPPFLPRFVVRDPSVEVSAGVGVNPFPLELLESEFLWGRGVSWQISFLPLFILWLQRLVAPTPSIRPAIFYLGRGRGGGYVAD